MSESVITKVRWEETVAVVTVAGDVDLHRSLALQKELLAVLDQKPSRMVVDLSAVPYMDSSGVASLVKLLSRVRALGAKMALAAPTPKVRSIFEITRLNSVFEIHESVEEALAGA